MTDETTAAPGNSSGQANGDYVVVARRYRPQNF